MRELRNHGGDVVERVEAGERLIVTRDGKAVAELLPLRGMARRSVELLPRWNRLPAVDAAAFRREIDAALDPGL